MAPRRLVLPPGSLNAPRLTPCPALPSPALPVVPDEWNLDSLLSSYSVQDMSVEPAGNFFNFDTLGDSPTFGSTL